MMRSKLNKQARAFTLIELLVVIAIISILAAILFPVFARARESARRASCMSNMKQIGLGIMQYTQDYDEKYPMAWYGEVTTSTRGSYKQTQAGTPGAYYVVCDPATCNSGGSGHFYTWMDFIHPYVKSVQLFTCPSATDNKFTSAPFVGQPIPSYHMNSAYSNAAFGNANEQNVSYYATYRFGMPIRSSGTPIAAITRPADTIMIYEVNGSQAAYQLAGSPYLWASLAGNASTAIQNQLRPHLEGANLTYGDGHAKWKSFAAMKAEAGAFTAYTPCDLNNISSSNYCSSAWNPFRQ